MAIVPYERKPSALVPYNPRPNAPSARAPAPPPPVPLPFNQTSFQLVKSFASSGRGFSGTSQSWWFTMLVMGGLFYWMDSEDQRALSSAKDQVAAHRDSLKWADRAHAHTPSPVIGAGMWAAKKLGVFDVEKAAESAMDEIAGQMPPLDSAIAGLKAGINPGPFRYAFEGSDPKSILRYAAFLLVATDEDWQGLIQTVAPVRSAPNIVKSVRQEFQRLAMYPAAGWLAGTAMGCALPLNVPIVTLAMAYNLVGASLAYSKGVDDLDRELKSAMPHIHDALNKRIDLAISRRMPGLAKKLRAS